MAAVCPTADMTILKNSQIVVTVEEALSDLLVVSYFNEEKKFHGVLLDSTKSNLPFGVYNLHPAFTTKQEPSENNNDNLHSISQRFAYENPDYAPKSSSRSKNYHKQKMTVRLRPRKVLCSNCQGICNENSQNVDVTKKRKLSVDSDDAPKDKKPSSTQKSEEKKPFVLKSTLIPKLSRLQPREISDAISGTVKDKEKLSARPEKARKIDKNTDKTDNRVTRELTFVNVTDIEPVSSTSNNTENCNDIQDSCPNDYSTLFANAKTLKISFGEGEGTVVKIPASRSDYEDSIVTNQTKSTKTINSKAAKRALKKAKKQAKRNGVNESRQLSSISSLSPNRHAGALSPRNNVTTTNPSNINSNQKKKHKVKHKKKNKDDKKQVGDENADKTEECDSELTNSIKEKLSLNLKRLAIDSFTQSGQCSGTDTEGDSDSCGEAVPEFPATGTGGGGGNGRVAPGDVVWGKVVGFPWWPGRVLSVTAGEKAHISWYASTTSSLMPCDSLSPFLDDYKLRFNKKKRGPYKEAVKLANLDARRPENSAHDPLGSPQPLPNVSPPTIDVFS